MNCLEGNPPEIVPVKLSKTKNAIFLIWNVSSKDLRCHSFITQASIEGGGGGCSLKGGREQWKQMPSFFSTNLSKGGGAWTKFGFLGWVLPNLGTPTTFRRTFGKKRDGTLRGAVQLCMQMTIFYSWCYYLLLMYWEGGSTYKSTLAYSEQGRDSLLILSFSVDGS